ncbi:hypothetical protein [uncultured Campylobacter sp.]|uniref:hypothetical protein n=1 Tax=uncultured Campylobacter sp. TaxID=218934 RepID=UPI00260478D1|nr:hypothetical protein [uncultured Campylobacter sp.]
MLNDEIARFGISKTRYDKNIKDFLQDKNCDKRNLAGGGLKFTSDGGQNSINASERNFTNAVEQKLQSNLSCATDTLSQNFKTQARNYDKEPIIIKDNSIEMIKFYSPFLYFLNFIDFGTRQDSPRSVKRWLELSDKFGTCYIKFKNSVIEYYSEKKRATLYSINLSEIIAIKRTFGPSTFKMTKKSKISTFFVAFVWIILLSLVVTFKNKISYGILIVPISLFLAFAPLIIFRFKKNLGFDIGNDSLIFMSNGNYIEASILTSKEYKELKACFLLKIGKNLDKIPPQIFV